MTSSPSTRIRIAKPGLPKRGMAHSVDATHFVHEATLAGIAAGKLVLDETRIDNLTIRQAELAGCTLVGAQWGSFAAEDTAMTQCDLSGARIEESRWVRVLIDGSKLTGTLINSSLIRDVRIVDCRADYSQWQQIKAQRLEFLNCNLAHAFFNDANLRGVRFRDCDLTGADFTHADLSGVDFRGSRLDGITVSVDQLNGVTVSMDQAILICGLIGLNIEDDPGLHF